MPDPHKLLEVDPKASIEVIQAAHKALTGKIDQKLLDEALEAAVNQAPEPVKKGKTVGNYRITNLIAEGGFGTTYKAEHLLTGKPVCIKHALHVSASDTAILLDEARLCWDLRHWGIPAMRDIIEMPDGSLAIVMSFIPGPTLQQIREMPKYQDGIDPEHVAWIVERTLNILKYLHYEGVINGDVKPANIIVQPESHHVALVDYGLSILRPKPGDKPKGYTPLYASPEHADGLPLIPESDLYSLGMTMIFALGGDPERVKVPGHTPPKMCEFIKNLIRRDPDNRPSWEKEDLCDVIQEIRLKDFGNNRSCMKQI